MMGHLFSTYCSPRRCHPVWVRARNGFYGALAAVRARLGVVRSEVIDFAVDKAALDDLEMQPFNEFEINGLSVSDLKRHLALAQARVKVLAGEAHQENHPNQRKKKAMLVLYYAILAFSAAAMFSLWRAPRNPSRWMVVLEGSLFTVAVAVTAVIQYLLPTEQCLRLATTALSTTMLMMGYSFMVSLYQAPAPTPAPAGPLRG